MRYIFGGDFHSSLHILLFTKNTHFIFDAVNLFFLSSRNEVSIQQFFFKFPVTRNTHEEHNFT